MKVEDKEEKTKLCIVLLSIFQVTVVYADI